MERPILYLGSTWKDLMKLPRSVWETFSQDLYTVSLGETPLQAKTLKGFGGRTVLELREDHRGNTFRTVYTVKFKEAVYVLHVFKKKSTRGIATPKKDMDLIEKRLKDARSHYKSHFKLGEK